MIDGERQTPPIVAWSALDVGGTKLRVLLFTRGEDGTWQVAARVQRRTPRGIPRLLAAVRSALAEAAAFAANRGLALAPALVAGTPGRYQPDAAGRRVIAPRSAMNLEAAPGETDNLDMQAALAAGVGLPIDRVFVDNDAVVQGRHLIQLLLDDPATRPRLLDQRVVCINPGTGLGGCVAAVNPAGAIEVFTDGHVSELSLQPFSFAQLVGDVKVKVATTDAIDRYQIEFFGRGRGHALTLASKSGKQAEDLIAGAGMAAFAQALDAGLSALGCDAPLLSEARRLDPIDAKVDGKLLSACLALGRSEPVSELAQAAARCVAALAGAALFELSRRLHLGSAHKGAGFPEWSADDVDRLRGVRCFVLGGGIAREPLGQEIAKQARGRWRDCEVELFALPEVTDEAGARGALSLVPEAVRAQIERAALAQPWRPTRPDAD
ncbi:MAG: hypothetical protein JXR83_05645 [Deltaproteobacteria bacterium]|nr:hypothetical protein [Deltaproteobacteria bacterium]